MAIAHGNIIIDTVLLADITRAHNIYGHNSNALQGKTTLERPYPFPELSIPRITDPQSMYADIFTANSMQFLITITKPLDHLLCTMIDNRETSTLRNALRKHTGFYGQGRIPISALYSDNERGISVLSSDLSAMGIKNLSILVLALMYTLSNKICERRCTKRPPRTTIFMPSFSIQDAYTIRHTKA